MEEMTDSQQEPSQLVNDISSLLVTGGAKMHEIQVAPENNLMLRVRVKDLTF